MQNWAAECMWGRECLKIGTCRNCHHRENICRVHHLVIDDTQLTINQIANATSISNEKVENILHDELVMNKLSTRWVVHELSPDQTRTRLIHNMESLALCEADPALFFFF